MIQIDKDIPAPISASNNRYPFKEMEVGDSFMVAAMDANTLRSAAAYRTKSLGHKYSIRKVPGGARIWRVE